MTASDSDPSGAETLLILRLAVNHRRHAADLLDAGGRIMEDAQFDRLVKSLASRVQRRGLLRVLLSAPLAMGLATRLEEASGQSGNVAIVGGGGGQRRHKKRHDPGDKKDRRQRKRRRQRRRERRRDQNTGDLSGGTCVPFNQVCCTLPFCNPCCDANAECLKVQQSEFEVVTACVDKSPTGCTSDADCRARFANPDVTCYDRFLFTCPVGVKKCCHPKICDQSHPCQDGVTCCPSVATLPQNVCCGSPSQSCYSGTGCLDLRPDP